MISCSSILHIACDTCRVNRTIYPHHIIYLYALLDNAIIDYTYYRNNIWFKIPGKSKLAVEFMRSNMKLSKYYE